MAMGEPVRTTCRSSGSVTDLVSVLIVQTNIGAKDLPLASREVVVEGR
jgi:hypothetical protein